MTDGVTPHLDVGSVPERVRIGIVSVSDRASSGVYVDQGLPALQDWLGRALKNPIDFEARLIPDEQALISATLIELVDAGCSLVLTTGGTGPAKRDVTPEATARPTATSRTSHGNSLPKSPLLRIISR